MTERVVGLEPWLPWPLYRWQWMTQPVRAERLAALRIGLAAVLLADILTTYWPQIHSYFGGDSMGSPEIFAERFREPRWYWSLLYGVHDHAIIETAALVWAVAAGMLLIGLSTRLSAVVAWLLSSSFATLNPYIDNAGDLIRGITLFYLMLCPCGAAWSIDACWDRWRKGTHSCVFVHPWPLRLLFLQMCFIYFMNGIYKLTGLQWAEGFSLYFVLGDLTLTRWSYAQIPIPVWITRAMTWTVLAWEVGFPLLVALPWTRTITLLFGVAFHVGIGLSMELGGFVFYMLCLYLPLVPWERWTDRRTPSARPVETSR